MAKVARTIVLSAALTAAISLVMIELQVLPAAAQACDPVFDANAHAFTFCEPDADPNANAYPLAFCEPNTDADADANAYANAVAITDTDPNTDPDRRRLQRRIDRRSRQPRASTR